MAISYNNAALVQNTAQKLVPEVPLGTTVIISNPSTADTIYLGASASLTATNGFPMPAYGVVRLDNVSGGEVWAYTTAATATVGILIANAY